MIASRLAFDSIKLSIFRYRDWFRMLKCVSKLFYSFEYCDSNHKIFNYTNKRTCKFISTRNICCAEITAASSGSSRQLVS